MKLSAVVVEGACVEVGEASGAGVDDTPGVGGNEVVGNPAVEVA